MAGKIIQTDILGEELGSGDYIISTLRHGESCMCAFQITGITRNGYLKLGGGQYKWYRSQLQGASNQCIKITKEQYEMLAKRDNYDV